MVFCIVCICVIYMGLLPGRLWEGLSRRGLAALKTPPRGLAWNGRGCLVIFWLPLYAISKQFRQLATIPCIYSLKSNFANSSAYPEPLKVPYLRGF